MGGCLAAADCAVLLPVAITGKYILLYLRQHVRRERAARAAVGSHHSPSGCLFTTRVRLRIMNRPPGFSSIATLKTARANASCRQIASVS
jgi:hypothetical protein